GRLKAEGSYDAALQAIQVEVNAELARSAWDKQVHVGQLEVNAYAAGALTDPHLSTQLKAREIRVTDRIFDRATVTAQGTLSSALVNGMMTEQKRSLELGAKLQWIEPSFIIERAHLVVDAARTSV